MPVKTVTIRAMNLHHNIVILCNATPPEKNTREDEEEEKEKHNVPNVLRKISREFIEAEKKQFRSSVNSHHHPPRSGKCGCEFR